MRNERRRAGIDNFPKGDGNESTLMTDFESKMLEKRQLLIGNFIDDECAKSAIAKLLFLQMSDEKAPISLYINSPGGSITATLAVIDTVAFVRPPIHTYGLSCVNGCALWILAAGTFGSRCCLSHSQLSIERTSSAAKGSEAQGFLRRLNDRMADELSSRSNLSRSDVSEALRSGCSFTPEEAIAVGIVDGLLEQG